MARLTRLTFLNLSCTRVSGGWQHLPQQLKHLYLMGIGLTSMPPELTRLSHPVELVLSVNLQLTGASLQVLGRLDLIMNDLAGGWQHLDGMQQLAHLSLMCCRMMAVPPVFSQLRAVTSLSMVGNPIVSGWQPGRHVAAGKSGCG